MDPHQPIEISGAELSAGITPYGGFLTELRVGAEAAEARRDVVLGYADEAGRRYDECSLGCLIGRHANRIRGGRFELDGWHHQLPCNATDTHLHGGATGFGAQAWTLVERSASTLHLHLSSADGHENYPGTLDVDARISVVGASTLRLEFEARTTRPTLCNLTWHPYFNLAGHDAGHVGDHLISIQGDSFLPMAIDFCPTGEIASVADTPFALLAPTPMVDGMSSQHTQIQLAGGFDHCWLIRGTGLRRAARVVAPQRDLVMEVWSTQPGLQFYSGNSLNLDGRAKEIGHYRPHDGFCLEAQGLPDASNHPGLPSNELRPGERYHQIIEYRFETADAGLGG